MIPQYVARARTLCALSSGQNRCQGKMRYFAVRPPGERGWSAMLCERHEATLKAANRARLAPAATRAEAAGILARWRLEDR